MEVQIHKDTDHPSRLSLPCFLPSLSFFLILSTFPFIPSTLIMSAAGIAANKTDKTSILGDLVQWGRQTLSPLTKEPLPCIHICKRRCKLGEAAQDALRWTNRVSLIWVLRESLLEGVIIKLPAAGCAGVIQGNGRDTVPGRGYSKGKDPRRAWSVHGAGGMPIRLEHPEREERLTREKHGEKAGDGT